MAPSGGPGRDFARFYRDHVTVVVAFCYRRTGDREMAADLAAEVFAAALRDRHAYRSELGPPRQWILGIAAHKTADAIRRGRVERRAQKQLGIREIAWSEDDLDYVHQVSGGQLEEMLEALPAGQREAIRARVINEHEYGEIAAESGLSEQVVRQRVSRGLSAMRRRWTRENP